MSHPKRVIELNHQGSALLSGDEAIALAALHCGVTLGTGYPGTPSTEILETYSDLGGKAQWAPNEKVAAEVALGVAFASGRALVTMKHVGLNVASDVLFTAAYSGVLGGYVLVCADDPGMASSQNEQDTRRYAVAAGVPMLEPSDSQEAYDFTGLAFEISERWQIPVILRVTTRVCHSHSLVQPHGKFTAPLQPCFERNIPERVMIPAHARPAHRRLRAKLAEMERWNVTQGPNRSIQGSSELGIIASGVSTMHAMEAAPEASLLKIGMTHPLPMELMRNFAAGVKRCVAIEEGDPYINDALNAAGVRVEKRQESYRFGELSVNRVRQLLTGEAEEQKTPPRGKPPQLCEGCPHRSVFPILKSLDCIVAGDIGCYTLAALPPLQAMDTQICMGASIGVGLGMRHTLPEDQARRVVSVIGDSTFLHSGVTGLIEMAYNPPATGHVVVIVDNGTTAMTGLQEHPGTGRSLDHTRSGAQIAPEAIARAVGIPNVQVFNPVKEPELLEREIKCALESGSLAVFVARQPCILAFGKIKAYEKAIAEAEPECGCGCNQPLSE